MNETRTYENSRIDEPIFSKYIAILIVPIFRFFDKLFHSKYNPVYRSGTIAILMFLLLVATGVYLLCFYKVGSPYESVYSIHTSIYFGSFIRTLHRYATDIGIVAVFFHTLQIILQGKTWGPRTLAWLSGVIMLVLFYVTAWTGYVMVWDSHGQLLAQAGADLIQAIPLIRDPVTQAFSGEKSLPDAFFFMNLFMHVAVPLLFVIGLWIHTAKIKRTQWLPPKNIRYGVLIILFCVCIFLPAPLLEKANLLKQIQIIPIDLFLSYWIPFISIFGSHILFYGGLFLFITVLSMCLWWKPSVPLLRTQSVVDEKLCTGCTQCAVDCPYEAITMVPYGDRKKLLAHVSTSNCVGCGICSASCSDFAIGPVNRNGLDQAQAAIELSSKISLEGKVDSIVAYCSNNPGINLAISKISKLTGQKLAFFPLQCAGTLHNETLTHLMKASEHVLIWGCAERVCMNRDGIVLLRGRFERKRVPFLDKKLDRSHASLETRSSWEVSEIVNALKNFGGSNSVTPYKKAAAVIFGVIFTFAIALASRLPMGEESKNGLIRVAGALPAVTKEHCRPLTDIERANLPKHMQRKEICEEKHSAYLLEVFINGERKLSKITEPAGLRGDRPVYLNADINIESGGYDLTIKLSPENVENANQFLFSKNVQIQNGQILLLVPDSKDRSLREIH